MPRQCAVCGETDGIALGHAWEAATCEAVKTCSRCGETDGSALGHDWMAATYTAPKTCSRCGQTEGSVLTRNIDVQKEIDSIRSIYNAHSDAKSNGRLTKKSLSSNVRGYYNSAGQLVELVVFRGEAGIGSDSDVYSRSYYFHNGELYFAFYEGAADSHRLYFADGIMIRWRYRSSAGDQVTDYKQGASSSKFQELERTAKAECEALL